MTVYPETALARQNALDTLVSFALKFREAIAFRRAVAGDAMDNLDVVGAQRRIYVRLGGIGGALAEAQYDQFKPALGVGLLLTRPNIFGTGGWLILGQTGGDALPCYPQENLA